MLLLGYALVEVPRNLWYSSDQTYVLHYAYFKASKLSSDKCEAEETVDDVLEVGLFKLFKLYGILHNF